MSLLSLKKADPLFSYMGCNGVNKLISLEEKHQNPKSTNHSYLNYITSQYQNCKPHILQFFLSRFTVTLTKVVSMMNSYIQYVWLFSC